MIALIPAGRFDGGAGLGGGGGGSTPVASWARTKRGIISSGGRSLIRWSSVHASRSGVGQPLVADPCGLEQREAAEAIGMACGERGRDRATARVADEVEALEPRRLGLAQHPVELGLEPVDRGRLVGGVDLEVLGAGVDPSPSASISAP
jgi:hypothetical protein